MSVKKFSREEAARKTKRTVQKLEKLFGIPLPPRKRSAPLDMLIATILSQNTNDINSHRAYVALRKKYPAWDKIHTAQTRSIAAAIRTGGMANLKATGIKNLLNGLKERFGSLNLSWLKKLGNDEIIDILCSFTGVGLKTVSCVLLFSLGRDVFPVDTHVHRICNRLGLVRGCKTPDKTYMAMKTVVPEGKAYSLHINLIRFGRKICRSAAPLCGICPLYRECEFSLKAKYRSINSPSADAKKVNFMLLENV
ncbi:MAG: endonuclease III domain-containing protein [Bacteroidota bacterium]